MDKLRLWDGEIKRFGAEADLYSQRRQREHAGATAENTPEPRRRRLRAAAFEGARKFYYERVPALLRELYERALALLREEVRNQTVREAQWRAVFDATYGIWAKHYGAAPYWPQAIVDKLDQRKLALERALEGIQMRAEGVSHKLPPEIGPQLAILGVQL